jgi:hypothetical protein
MAVQMQHTNKYRAAIEALQRGRDLVVDDVADDILDRWADSMIEGGYAFGEFIESQGTRLHFLGLLIAQLEQTAEAYEDALAAEPPPAKKPRKPRAKKLPRQQSTESKTDDSN